MGKKKKERRWREEIGEGKGNGGSWGNDERFECEASAVVVKM
jgi:hypothetical protein